MDFNFISKAREKVQHFFWSVAVSPRSVCSSSCLGWPTLTQINCSTLPAKSSPTLPTYEKITLDSKAILYYICISYISYMISCYTIKLRTLTQINCFTLTLNHHKVIFGSTKFGVQTYVVLCVYTTSIAVFVFLSALGFCVFMDQVFVLCLCVCMLLCMCVQQKTSNLNGVCEVRME